MTDWKNFRDYGIWPFKKQKNKWGYLNNPRWLAVPRRFAHGGPDDYNGRADEEPQIWTPTGNAKYPSGSAKTHHQCGHWHLEPFTAGWGPPPPPPLDLGYWWQASVDAWVDGDAIVISARQWFNDIKLTRVYKGVIDEAGDITWSTRMSFYSHGSFSEPPLRIVNDVILHYTFALEAMWPAPTWMFRDYEGSFSQEEVFDEDEWQSEPGWEEFDMHSTGRVVVGTSTDVDGLMIRVSTDYGATFGPKQVIDYLYTLLGAENYTYQYCYKEGMCIQVDEYTGTFYLLTQYADPDTWEYIYILLKSTTGNTWDLVREWDNSDGRFYTDLSSLAVSNGHLYVAFTETDADQPVVYCSDDDGATWTETIFPVNYWQPSLAAHEGVCLAMMPEFDVTARNWHIKKTTDNGVSWTDTMQVNSVPPHSLPGLVCKGLVYAGYRNIRASGPIFIATYCGAAYPNPDTEWVDQDSIAHSMAGAGETPRIPFWLSTDNAMTWEMHLSPFEAWIWW